jgi:biotin carboxyl carrier protein
MTAAARSVRVTLAVEVPDGPPALVVEPAATSTDAHARDGKDARLAARRALVLPMEPVAGQPSGVERREVVIDGWRVEVLVEPEARAALRERATRGRAEAGASGPTKVHAIIPGVVVAVSVAPGDAVTAGQQLLVVEVGDLLLVLA